MAESSLSSEELSAVGDRAVMQGCILSILFPRLLCPLNSKIDCGDWNAVYTGVAGIVQVYLLAYFLLEFLARLVMMQLISLVVVLLYI